MKFYLKWLFIGLGVTFVIWAAVGVFMYYRTRDLFQIQNFDMLPGLAFQDVVRIDRDAYRTKKPEPGDIVVYSKNNAATLIYRIVGVPGDRLFVAPKGSIKWNGQEPTAKFIGKAEVPVDGKVDIQEIYEETIGNRTFQALYHSTLPPFSNSEIQLGTQDYFVMGDNRDAGSDSRTFGPIRAQDIIGRVVKIVESADKSKVGKEL